MGGDDEHCYDQDDGGVPRLGCGASAVLLAADSTLADPSATCHGSPAAIVGTDQGDTSTGTAGNDIVVLGGGDDTFNGLGGNDVVCGEDGADDLTGGPGTTCSMEGRGPT